MPLVRCEYCGERVRKIVLHEKDCFRKRQVLKRRSNAVITQSIEYRLEKLQPFEVDSSKLRLDKMSDIGFNDLVDKLTAVKAQGLEKKQEQEELENVRKKRQEDAEAEQEKLRKQDEERRIQEEVNRLAQAKLVEENLAKKKLEDAERERVNQEKMNKPPVEAQKPNSLQSLVDDSADKLKKKRGRPAKDKQ